MLVLRFLNVVAPAYFLCISLVTFVLQLFLFIPSMFKDPSTTPLFSSALLHGALFLFLSANALGNYILVIQNSPEDLGKGLNLGRGAEVVADWPDGSWVPGSALPGTHFCRLCARVTQRHDHHCFFTGNCIGSRNMRNFIMFCLYTSLACLDSLMAGVAYISAALSTSFANPLAFLTLLPHSISQFFSVLLFLVMVQSILHHGIRDLAPPYPVHCDVEHCHAHVSHWFCYIRHFVNVVETVIMIMMIMRAGALLSSEMFVILMLYLWLGIGLACAGFCCHQMLLILRGQMRYQVRKGMAARARPWRKNLQEVFGKRWLLGLLIPMLNVGSDYHRQKEK